MIQLSQTILDAHVVRHRIVDIISTVEHAPCLIRVRQASSQLVLPDRRLGRRRGESRVVLETSSVVVDTHVSISSTNLHNIAIHRAATVPTAFLLVGNGCRVDVIVAVAFLRILDAAQAVAFVGTDVLAEFDCHKGVVCDEIGVQWAVAAGAVVVAT